MKFVLNDTTTKYGLVQDVESNLGWDYGVISGDTDALARCKVGLNKAYSRVLAWFAMLGTNWTLDDFAYTNEPRGLANLVDEQNRYELPVADTGETPTSLLAVDGISVKDNAGNLVNLIPAPMSEEEIDQTYTNVAPGVPKYYLLKGKFAKFWPNVDAASVTLAQGLVVYFRRCAKNLTSNTDEPAIVSTYQPLISLEYSIDYAVSKGMAIAAGLKIKRDEMKAEAEELYSMRGKKVNAQMIPVFRSSR